MIHRASSTIVGLVPARRVVFTYGWERAEVAIPPGSTTVETWPRRCSANRA